MEDCKISHVSEKVIDEEIAWLRKQYESIFEDGSGKDESKQRKSPRISRHDT